jgi:hypothetical protein
MNALIMFIERKMYKKLYIIADVPADHNSHVILVFCCNSYKRLRILSQSQ